MVPLRTAPWFFTTYTRATDGELGSWETLWIWGEHQQYYVSSVLYYVDINGQHMSPNTDGEKRCLWVIIVKWMIIQSRRISFHTPWALIFQKLNYEWSLYLVSAWTSCSRESTCQRGGEALPRGGNGTRRLGRVRKESIVRLHGPSLRCVTVMLYDKLLIRFLQFLY